MMHLRAEQVVTPDGVLIDAVVGISEGKITWISEDPGAHENPLPGSASSDLELVGGWLLPGFVDTHVHGGGGADFATTDPHEARRAIEFHRQHGTTTSLASLVTAPIETLIAQLQTLAPLVQAGELAGLHLEGPFLSAAKCGAHDPALLISPDRSTLDQLLAAGQGAISVITIAPELPGALEAASYLSGQGVRVAFGHSDADAAGAAAVIESGATVATHLFNAMRGIHHRDAGPVPTLLTDPRVTVELVCDGVHLDADVIALAIAAAGVRRVALVTDAMIAAGMPDGHFLLGELEVVVAEGIARLASEGTEPGSIAGSTLTMDKAVEFVIKRCGVSIPDAAVLAAATPARAYGLSSVGEIVVGAAADFAVVNDDGELLRSMRRGSWVDR